MANFTKGSQWEIIKDFKGRSHAEGGIDISIDDDGISLGGIVIPGLNFRQDNLIVQDNTNIQRPVVNLSEAKANKQPRSTDAQLNQTATTRDKISRGFTVTGAALLGLEGEKKLTNHINNK